MAYNNAYDNTGVYLVKQAKIKLEGYGIPDPSIEVFRKYLKENVPYFARIAEPSIDFTIKTSLKWLAEHPEVSFVSVDTSKTTLAQAFSSRTPTTTFLDVGGMSTLIEKACKTFSFKKKRSFTTAPLGLLIHGSQGCGKSLFAEAIASHLNMKMYSVDSSSLIGGVYGETEKNIRALFDAALADAPAVIILDNIDILVSTTNDAHNVHARATAQLSSLFDDIHRKYEETSKVDVFVVSITNTIDIIDSRMRRTGRFDVEMCIPSPTPAAREDIFRIITQRVLGVEADEIDMVCNVKDVVLASPGFVGADYVSLAQHVGRTSENNDRDPIHQDFVDALLEVQPTNTREGFIETPSVTWDDIGGLEVIREELKYSFILPLMKPELYEAYGAKASSGLLLYGPPGCGKTLIAKALANEVCANFISIKGPELLNSLLGGSERAIRNIFAKARNSAPCILFFDEIDAIASSRSSSSKSDSGSLDRVVNQLLTEMDGVSDRKGVFVLAATNRKDKIDPALLRPGRFDRHIEVTLPGLKAREKILRATIASIKRKTPKLRFKVSIEKLAIKTEGMSGADLAFILRDSSVEAIKDLAKKDAEMDVPENPSVLAVHVLRVLKRVRASKDHNEDCSEV